MKKIGIYYGTTSGITIGIVDEIEFQLKGADYEVHNVEDGISEIGEYENLILISPTYGVGELQRDWQKEYENLKNVDFSNKKVGIVGIGNQLAFGESYAGAMRKLYDVVTEGKGEIIGFTSTQGYHYKDTESVIDDMFVGLALDESNQDNETPDRIEAWIKDIKNQFN